MLGLPRHCVCTTCTSLKKGDFRKGITQNEIQLESSFSKHTEEADETPPSAGPNVLGVVTNACTWYILEGSTENNQSMKFKSARLVPII